jgi:hypothetical protein
MATKDNMQSSCTHEQGKPCKTKEKAVCTDPTPQPQQRKKDKGSKSRYVTPEYAALYKLAKAFMLFDNACDNYIRRMFSNADLHETKQRIFGEGLRAIEAVIEKRAGGQILDAVYNEIY